MNINKEDILKIINEVDPADLVPGIVTPDDEYESEVEIKVKPWFFIFFVIKSYGCLKH
jgi:hypothetical protein